MFIVDFPTLQSKTQPCVRKSGNEIRCTDDRLVERTLQLYYQVSDYLFFILTTQSNTKKLIDLMVFYAGYNSISDVSRPGP